MIQSAVDATIHFKHSSEEVERLAAAIVPLHDNIVAVGTPYERGNMRRILNCNFFRRREALGMRNMLIRAAKHAKANLSDYFPMMHPIILKQAQELEEALTDYWEAFRSTAAETQPTH